MFCIFSNHMDWPQSQIAIVIVNNHHPNLPWERIYYFINMV